MLTMPKPCVFSIVESPLHPKCTEHYARLGYEEMAVNSIRKALNLLKKHAPVYVIAEFRYGYGSNYSGVHISNLDVLLVTLLKYAPNARVIVLVDKNEQQYIAPLNDILPLHAVLQNPAKPADILAHMDAAE